MVRADLSGATTPRCDVEPDTELRGYVGYGMKRAFNAIQADLNATLAPLGLRMLTFSALSVICAAPGLRQARLAAVLSVERPNLVLLIDDLEGRDLIRRDPDPDDRRAQSLTATPQGRDLHRRAQDAVRDHDRRMTGALSEQDRATLVCALAAIETAGQKDST